MGTYRDWADEKSHFQGMSLTVTWDPAGSLNLLEWSELIVTDDNAPPPTYVVYRKFGYADRLTPGVQVDSSPFWIQSPQNARNNGWQFVGAYDGAVIAIDKPGPNYGTWSYIVFANLQATNQTTRSNIDVSKFVHSLTRTDGTKDSVEEGEEETGGQWQFNQVWNIGYNLQTNAFTNITIFSSNTVINDFYPTDSYGMYIATGSKPSRPPQVIYQMSEDAVRSFEMSDGSWNEFMIWHCTDEMGKLVPRGIYMALVETWVPRDNPFPDCKDDDMALRGTELISIPVRGPTIKEFTTKGIKAFGELAEINYNINCAAKAKMVVAKPFTEFKKATTDGSLVYLTTEVYDYEVGDPLPLLAGSTWQVDADRILSYKNAINDAGWNAFSWDGRTDRGVSCGRGIFRVAISATDAFGYHTYDTEGMITDSIAVDERIDDIEVDRRPPLLQSSTPQSDSVIRHSLSKIAAVLTDPSGLDTNNTTITLEGPDPDNPVLRKLYTQNDVGIELAVTGSTPHQRQFTLSFEDAITLNGDYQMTVHAVDTQGNGEIYTIDFSLNISESEEAFRESLRAYPQPADTGMLKFEYRTMGEAHITIEIFNLLQQLQLKVLDNSYISAAGLHVSNPWDLCDESGNKLPPGLYYYRVTADYTEFSGEKFMGFKKLVIIE